MEAMIKKMAKTALRRRETYICCYGDETGYPPLWRSLLFLLFALAHVICVDRVASAEISKSLEVCENELQDLGAELEELTEAFEEAARRTQQQLDMNNSRCVPRTYVPSTSLRSL